MANEIKKPVADEALARKQKIAELQRELEDLTLTDIGEHKIVYELEPVFKDVKKGGDPTYKVRKEFFPDEGKCVYCGFDMREDLGLPPLPEELTVEEKRELESALANHEATFLNEDPIPPGHHQLMTKRKTGVVPAGDNPNKVVENIAGKTTTLKDVQKREKQIERAMEKGRQEYRREV